MGTLTVNGKKYDVPDGTTISIIDGVVLVDGKPITDDADKLKGRVTITWDGPLMSLSTDASVTVNGNVNGNVKANGSVTAGEVRGNVSAGGSVSCGSIGGAAAAGGSLQCAGNVGGTASAGGSVRVSGHAVGRSRF